MYMWRGRKREQDIEREGGGESYNIKNIIIFRLTLNCEVG